MSSKVFPDPQTYEFPEWVLFDDYFYHAKDIVCFGNALTVENLKEKARRETGLVALKDGRIVGCVFLLERTDDLYVGKLAVEPSFQGQGIARRLMQAAEDLARNRNRTAIELQTRIELTGKSCGLCRSWLSRDRTDGWIWEVEIGIGR